MTMQEEGEKNVRKTIFAYLENSGSSCLIEWMNFNLLEVHGCWTRIANQMLHMLATWTYLHGLVVKRIVLKETREKAALVLQRA